LRQLLDAQGPERRPVFRNKRKENGRRDPDENDADHEFGIGVIPEVAPIARSRTDHPEKG
jgi:hypothetical protein